MALSSSQLYFDFLLTWYSGSLSQSRKGVCISAVYISNFYPKCQSENKKKASKFEINENVDIQHVKTNLDPLNAKVCIFTGSVFGD